MNMKAALLYGKEDIRIERWELPEVKGHDLLLRVLTCGICGSDARYFFNGPSARYINPVILGHEMSGEVVQAGPDVRDYSVGDLVTLAPIIPCMRCYFCAHGQDNICEEAKVVGCNSHGAMAEYVFVPGQMVEVGGVVKLPRGTNHREAALSELVGCCLHGLAQIGLAAGDRVMIIGGGPIGMTFTQLAKLIGARVTSSELLPLRRKMARELGADETVDPEQIDLTALYPRAFDRVIVATASVPATQEALELVRPGGSLLLFSGYLKGAALEWALNDIHYREIHIHGSIDCTIQDFQKAVRLLPQLRMSRLITGCFPLDRTTDGFYAARDPQAIKLVIEPY